MQRTIFFDLGNVVLFFSREKMCQQIAELCRVSDKKIYESLFEEKTGLRYERGEMSSQDLYKHFCALSGKELKFKELMHAAADIFTPNASLEPVLKELKHQGVRLVLLSNTCEAHFNYAYLRYPVLYLFDKYVLSYEVGALKPEEKIYQTALSHALCPKEACFYTDDIPEYIDAARKVGIDAETFISTDSLIEHLHQRHFLV